MVDALLTAGDSSRLQQNLVKGKQSVVQYEAEPRLAVRRRHRLQGPWLLRDAAAPQADFHRERRFVEQAQGEIAKLQNEPVAAAGAGARQDRDPRQPGAQTADHRAARAPARHYTRLFDGKAELINTELDPMLAVTPAQIQAAAKKYLTPERRIVLNIVPAPPAPGAKKEAN